MVLVKTRVDEFVSCVYNYKVWTVLISITFTQFCITVLKFIYCQVKLLDTFEKLLKKEQSSAEKQLWAYGHILYVHCHCLNWTDWMPETFCYC